VEYNEVLKNAKKCIGPYCKACNVCNGAACKNTMPGPGAKGTGDLAVRNYQKWQEIRINMDTLCAQKKVETTSMLFGKSFEYPFFAGPVGAVKMHYGDKYTEQEYNDILVSACSENGIAAFTGDGIDSNVMKEATEAIAKSKGVGVPTVKPWEMVKIREKMEMVKRSGAFAVAMDIDAAGLPFLQNLNPPAGGKSVEELKEIVKMAEIPFILKGVMTPRAALKAAEAGVQGIIVSNHGGRVLDQCPSTAEVLPSIVSAVGGGIKILVDGGIRTGVDVFKALGMGADMVLIARPFVTAVYGGGENGVNAYVNKIGSELRDTMSMCGAFSLSEIGKDMIWN
jgi:4-hydroxymandelate oxidase